ncbi:hypothetical protein PYCC9005_004409 [Savitreella phatthalungensis]
MKGIQLKEYVKSPADLKVTTDLPEPKAGPDDLLIEIHAAGTNFFDILQVQGKYQTQPPFPWIAGAEYAGVVLQAPSDSQFKAGDKVFGGAQGAYAERIAVPDVPGTVLPIPEGWTFAGACGLFITAPTAYLALVGRGKVQAGEIVLVHAAAGGVGLAAVQIAKALGATVIATAGTQEKLEIAKRFGADHVINYRDKDWIDQVKTLTADNGPNGGCDVIYDPVGMVDQSLKVVAWNGRILIIGFAGGKIEKVAMNKALLKQCSIVGVFWGGNAMRMPHEVPGVWDGLLEMMRKKQIKPTIFNKVYNGVESTAEALMALGSRGTWGKVVVDIKGTSAKAQL